jgi:hypothetical protein
MGAGMGAGAGRAAAKGTLACKFFLLVVRHFEGALLICFVARKWINGHRVPKKLCERFLCRFARGKTTDGGEEVNHRKESNDHAGTRFA